MTEEFHTSVVAASMEIDDEASRKDGNSKTDTKNQVPAVSDDNPASSVQMTDSSEKDDRNNIGKTNDKPPEDDNNKTEIKTITNPYQKSKAHPNDSKDLSEFKGKAFWLRCLFANAVSQLILSSVTSTIVSITLQHKSA